MICLFCDDNISDYSESLIRMYSATIVHTCDKIVQSKRICIEYRNDCYVIPWENYRFVYLVPLNKLTISYKTNIDYMFDKKKHEYFIDSIKDILILL